MHWRGTVSLGRWGGIPVRLHWIALLFVALQFLRAAADPSVTLGRVALAVVALAIALIIHEWGHRLAGRRLEVNPAGATIGPFGDLEPVALAGTPREERALALGGLAMTGAASIVLFAYVLATDQVHSFFFRFDPPGGAPDPFAILWAAQLDLFVINLVPAYPFDGGRILYALIHAARDARTAVEKVVLCSRFCAVGSLIVWLLDRERGGVVLFAGMLCWVGGEIERRRFAAEAEREPWQGPLDAVSEPGAIARWWGRRRELEEARRAEVAARERVAEAADLDRLLDQVHREGMESLTRRERKFLERVGKRMRESRRGGESTSPGAGGAPDDEARGR